MSTAVKPNQYLLTQAIKLGKFKSGKQAINAALEAYILLENRRSLIALAGRINYLPDYDHKKNRARKSK
jgi:hypothetical protein